MNMNLPFPDQEPMIGGPVTVYGEEFLVSRHARRRYHERVDASASDREIVIACLDDQRAVWDDEEDPYLLVTYLSGVPKC